MIFPNRNSIKIHYTLQLLKQLPPKNITARMLLHFSKVSVYI
nr:MAG TPA: hypothetical protein [Caudoviricetes sp.]